MAMKLASLVAALLLSTAAHADDRMPMDPYGGAQASSVQAPFGAPSPRHHLRQLLLQNFDRNHDGRLEPRERRQAARALQRLSYKLMRQNARQLRRQRFIR